jgi:two-component system, OmpR family, response regulator
MNFSLDPDPHTVPLDLQPETAHEEPLLSAEQTRPFEEAALIGGEQLSASGFFVDIVRRAQPGEPVVEPLVLVVEDDPGTSRVIDAVLKKHGFATRLAENLQGVLRGVNARPLPHMILLDIMLPDANGFAVLERLRRHPDLRHIPVVMLSSLSDPADVAKGLALGAAGYLSKPARPQALVAAARSVLGLEV